MQLLANGEKQTVLITGGARGVTSEIACELAQSGVHMVLVGRTPLPGKEDSKTATLKTIPELRAALIAGTGNGSGKPSPVQIERTISAILRDREIRANIARLEKLGASIEYHACDVTDEAAFAALIDDVRQRLGGIDAVLHGAGMIDDKLIVDKSEASFNRVFDTKVDSTFILRRHLDPATLKLLVLFTSVAGRFGNIGQSDYASANEVLNRMAWQLKDEWPDTRIIAINWGPWDTGSGMVTDALRKQFAERGVMLITPESGRDFFRNELFYGQRDSAEVIAADGDLSGHGFI